MLCSNPSPRISGLNHFYPFPPPPPLPPPLTPPTRKTDRLQRSRRKAGIEAPFNFACILRLMVPMIIKGLFRRYEGWNPVHPTYGAFWGMGVGVGCGIGWGPGFGPEVIGYVGAGCGVGFSVGITFAGVGIGLPTTNFIFQLPYKALTVTTSGAMYFARSSGLLSIRNDAGNNGWDDAKVNRFRLQSFKHQQLLKKTVDFPAMNTFMSTKTRLIFDCFDQVKSRFGHSR